MSEINLIIEAEIETAITLENNYNKWQMGITYSDSKMSNTQLLQYLSEHRQNEKAFSQALEILISRKKSF